MGDESKAAIAHRFSQNYEWQVRFSGGANAGHTVYRDGKKYVHNLLPSVDYRHPNTKSFLASGMVIDLAQLYKEVKQLSQDFPGAEKTIYVDPDAFLVTEAHKAQDKAKNAYIGSTNRGIGPAYSDKMNRSGLRIKDIILNRTQEDKGFFELLKELGVNFKHSLELDFKDNILFEGAQGVLLDINHGTYPYVSCGESALSGIHSSGFSSIKIDKVYGISKAYSTRVGNGPFPTEVFDSEAEELREIGKEYGATTGRPRRIGWLDLPALKYAVKKAGITDLIITKLDILNNRNFKVCTSYDKTLVCAEDFNTVKPNYKLIEGWKDASINDSFVEVFLKLIENETGCKVSYYTFGVDEKSITKRI